jgi:hypothetical protein
LDDFFAASQRIDNTILVLCQSVILGLAVLAIATVPS